MICGGETLKNLIIMLYGIFFMLLSISCCVFMIIAGSNNLRDMVMCFFSLIGFVLCTVAFFRGIKERKE